MFSIGERVVHPMHGAGVIDDIVEERIAGVRQQYYVFKMPVGGLILKIPTANSEVIGLRTIITSAEANALLEAIPALETESTANWNKRYQENMQRLKSGDLYEVSRVIKALVHRDRQRGLSTGERKMLHSARQILLSELVLSTERERKDVEAQLDHAMIQTQG
jgi:CarD family transcriptional regulator